MDRLRASQVPVLSESYFAEFTSAWRPTFVGQGASGDTFLVSSGVATLVLKLFDRETWEDVFAREVSVLCEVRGIAGV